MKEKAVDAAIVAYAKSRGLVSVKLTMLATYGFAGLPDRMFLGPGRLVFFIEMKRPGGKMSDLQFFWQKKMEALGFHVYECDDIQYGKDIIDYELQPS